MRKSNKAFAKELEARPLLFAVDVLEFSSNLPNSLEALTIRRQVSKSGTSVGANYKEANRARSPKDFKNKINICVSEASETDYWFEIIEYLKWGDHRIDSIHKEAKELLGLFTSISTNTKT